MDCSLLITLQSPKIEKRKRKNNNNNAKQRFGYVRMTRKTFNKTNKTQKKNENDIA